MENCDGISNAQTHYDMLLSLKSQFIQDSQKVLLSDILEAFGNKDRFLILDILAGKDRCVCELEAILQKTQPAVSHHLKILEKHQLIRGWKKGKFTHYSLVRSRFQLFLDNWNKWFSSVNNWFGVEKV